jgi:hypothetical protein
VGKLFILLFFILQSLISPYLKAGNDINQPNLMGNCEGVGLGRALESNLVIFDSLEGVDKFVHDSVPRWAEVSIHESSKATIERFFKGKVNIETFRHARDFFVESLHVRLMAKANEYSAIDNDCEMEIASIIDAMSKNKIYNLFNNNFHNVFVEYDLPLKIASTNNYIEILMLISLPTVESGSGICKVYKQKGVKSTVEVTICN